MAKRPGLRIDVRIDVLMDERYEALGDIAGYNRHEALGRMFALWAWCLDRQEFVVHAAIVRRFLGPRGVEAILGEVVPGEIVESLALGERRDGGIYVRGSDSLAWLGERRAAATKGGEERARGVRDSGGRFVSEPTRVPPKRHPTSSQETTQTPPNIQPSDPDPALDPEDLDQPPSGERGGSAQASPSPRPDALRLVPQEPTRKRESRKPKIPLPDAWSPRREESDLARTLGLDLENQAERFRNHFVSVAGRKANWDLTFRNWLHESADRKRPANHAGGNGGLDAVMRIARGES